MSLLCLYLLGSPRIEIDGSPVNADTRKATALLAYIAATGESYRRDSLVNLLWPEYDQSRGRTNLRRTIYALRKALSGDWLDIDRENVGLKANANIYLDVDQFHYHLSTCLTHGHSPSQVCQSCLEPLATVVKLYRGDFMSGFSLKDSINFDEWQFLETNILRREFANALERYVECLSAKSDFDAATHYAKHWLTFDPLNEAAHCKLMQLYDWSGKRPEVYRQYQACVQVLKDEMGISPQPSTTTLYKNIVRGQGVDPPTFKGRGQASPGEVNDSESTLPIVTLISHSSTIQESSRSVFVAREREMEGLHNSLEAALEGKGRIVFITGAAGQGKSALLQEFARNAQNHYPDLLYASGNCNAQTGIGDPYLPFREILGLLTGDVDSLWAAGAISQEYARRIWDTFPLVTGTLVEVGPDLIETLIPGRPLARRAAAYVTGGINIQRAWLTQLEKIVSLREDYIHDPNLQQAALFEQFTQMMTSLSRERPLLLALDDLQWADIGSISLLFHIGRQLLGRRILILGAYRPEELAIGRGGERHPLEAVINEFQRAYGDITIDLTQADRQKFVESYLDSEPNRFSTNFRKTLYHQTKGHPLFTVELLRGMQERGNLVQDLQGCWVEGEMLDWDILPTRIEAVIAERIGRLDPESQEILRIASVEGEVFTAEVVARVLSLDEQNMIRRLSDRLERIHHLVRAQEIQRLGTRRLSRYRFRHILFQNYLYHCLDPVERTYLHEVIGTALENIHEGETQEIAVSLARHFQEAGIPEKTIVYLFQAGEKAKRGSAHDAAIVHLTQGLTLLERLPKTSERDQLELELNIALGVPLVLTKGHCAPEVEQTYIRARNLSREVGDDSMRYQALLGLRRFYLHRGSLKTALGLGEELIAQAQDMQDPVYLSRAYMMHIEVLYRLGEFPRIHTYYCQGLDNYQSQESLTHVLRFGNDTGIGCRIFETLTLWHLGYPERALSSFTQILTLARELSHPFTLVFALYFAATLHQLCRDAPSAKTCIDEMLQISQDRGFSMYIAWGTVVRGWVLSETGKIKAGINQMKEGLSAWQDMGAKFLLPNFMFFLADAYRKADHIDEGLQTLALAMGIMEETGERTFEAELYRLKGELSLLKGTDRTDADTCFQHALQIARQQDARAWELRTAASLYRSHEKGSAPDEVYKTLRQIYNWYREGHELSDMIEAKELLSSQVSG